MSCSSVLICGDSGRVPYLPATHEAFHSFLIGLNRLWSHRHFFGNLLYIFLFDSSDSIKCWETSSPEDYVSVEKWWADAVIEIFNEVAIFRWVCFGYCFVKLLSSLGEHASKFSVKHLKSA